MIPVYRFSKQLTRIESASYQTTLTKCRKLKWDMPIFWFIFSYWFQFGDISRVDRPPLSSVAIVYKRQSRCNIALFPLPLFKERPSHSSNCSTMKTVGIINLDIVFLNQVALKSMPLAFTAHFARRCRSRGRSCSSECPWRPWHPRT